MDTGGGAKMKSTIPPYTKGISVIICTFNGAERLVPTLKALQNQILGSEIQVEVILVNNRSTDSTVEVSLSTWGEFHIPLIVEFESEPGVSRARRKGIEVAKYEYILFCDDDNHLFSDYLSLMYSHFEQNANTIMIGGQGIALPEIEPPLWFKEYKESYAAAPQGEKSGPAYMLYNAGMGIRKSYFLTLMNHGFTFYLTSRLGKALTSGEDSELCYAFHMAGWGIWYEENMKFYHFIPQGRLNWNYLIRLHKGFSSSYIILNQYKSLLHSDSYTFKPINELLYYIAICIKYYIPYLRSKEGDKLILHYHGWKIIAKDLFGYIFFGKRNAHTLPSMFKKLTSA